MIVWQPATTELFKDLRSVATPISQADVNALKGLNQITGQVKRLRWNITGAPTEFNSDLSTTKLKQSYITGVRAMITSYLSLLGITQTWTQPITRFSQALVQELRDSLNTVYLLQARSAEQEYTRDTLTDPWVVAGVQNFAGYLSGAGNNYHRIVYEVDLTNTPISASSLNNLKLSFLTNDRVLDTVGIDTMRAFLVNSLSDTSNFTTELGSLTYTDSGGVVERTEIPINGALLNASIQPAYILLAGDFERSIAVENPIGGIRAYWEISSGSLRLICDDD